MKPHYDDGTVTVWAGDCIEVMRSLPEASVDAVVTDPPYGLDFMGKHWDTGAVAFNVETWTEALRVLKPGGHLAAFGGTRTWHRLACAIEDAGFEIRDSIHWTYGSGFPKSLDVSKAIDKAAGATRGTAYIPQRNNAIFNAGKGKAAGVDRAPGVVLADPPVTDAARQWQGWGTALKPAHEPIVLARKPLSGTVAATVLEHGTGALNVDGCRVGTPDGRPAYTFKFDLAPNRPDAVEGSPLGRWPANVVLTHAADCDPDGCGQSCPVAEMDRQSGEAGGNGKASGPSTRSAMAGGFRGTDREPAFYGDTGGASRFFPVFDWPFRYQAKANKHERPRLGGGSNSNMSNPRCRTCGKKRLGGIESRCMCETPDLDYGDATTNTAHPTVKPLDLMRWLVRLVTPPGGVVLEPFAGSGTTAEACIIEGLRCIAIEREPDYLPLIVARLSKPIQPTLGGDA